MEVKWGGHGSGARGESGAIYLVTDSPTVYDKLIVDALSSKGKRAAILNVSETPVYKIRGTALLRLGNPYAAVVYGQIAEASINPPEAIFSALNRLSWVSKFGPPHVVVSTDVSVEKVELERPWFLMTAWRLELDGPVTSVEGAKSVLEHRMYMKNPLSKVSLVVPKPHKTEIVFATVKNATGLVADVLSHLGLLYARVVVGDYGGRYFIIDVDPVPRIESKEEALAVAELI